MITDNDRSFIGNAIVECAKKGIEVSFIPQKELKTDNFSCIGFFNNDEKKIIVATKNSQRNWFSTFLHEFCHFKQWQNKEASFMNLVKNSRLDFDMWDWLNGENIPLERVRKSIDAYRRMELNCEKMAVNFIKAFNLSLDLKFYIKLANIYILSYGILEKTRKWVNFSFNDKKLLNVVPDKFIKSFRMSKEFERRIKQYFP